LGKFQGCLTGVAEMLVSNDPAIFAKGIKEVGSNPNLTRAFNMLGARPSHPVTAHATSRNGRYRSWQGALPSHADENQP